MKYAILLMFSLPFGAWADESDHQDQNAGHKAVITINDDDADASNALATEGLNLGENHDSFSFGNYYGMYGLAGYPWYGSAYPGQIYGGGGYPSYSSNGPGYPPLYYPYYYSLVPIYY